MFDEFSLFDTTSFDDIMNDSYATESYNPFDDSYSFALEAEEGEGSDDKKKSPKIIEAIKGIVKKFIDGIAQFMATLKNFLFGASRSKTGADGKKFSQKVIPNLFAFLKEIGAKAKTAATNKVMNASKSSFLAMEAGASAADDYAMKENQKRMDDAKFKADMAKHGATGMDAESVVSGFEEELKKLDKNDSMDICYAQFLKKLISDLKSAKPESNESEDAGATTKIVGSAEAESKKLEAEVKSAGNAAAKEGTPTALQKFKIFVNTIGFFFKYFARGVKAAWIASGALLKYKKAERDAKKAEKKKESGFLGRIAEESYNEGYQAALKEYGLGAVSEEISYESLFSDDNSEPATESEDYMKGYYAALADLS